MVFGDVIQSNNIVDLNYEDGVGGDDTVVWVHESYNNNVYELSGSDLSVIRSSGSPASTVNGIGGSNNVIWLSDNTQYELSTSDFSVLRNSSGDIASMGIGGNENVIYSPDYIGSLHELSTSDFSSIRSKNISEQYPLGAGGDEEVVWYSDRDEEKIYKISPSDFSVSETTSQTGVNDVGGTKNTLWAITAVDGDDAAAQLQIPSPESPTNVVFTNTSSEDELRIDWDEVSSASGYYVYRAQSSGSTTADYTQIADVTGPPYTDTGLEDGEKYYYRISSHN